MIEWKDKKIIAEATTTARGSHVEYGKMIWAALIASL